MCGIFGYVGEKRNTADTVLQGLNLLLYRGYDSWGVSWKEGGALEVKKEVGKIPNTVKIPKSNLFTAHTRWATTGGVTTQNAHPHLSCDRKISVVHNGIIENFEDLKKKLENKGHKFSSETDTEVFAHLVEENLKKEGFASSVRDAFNEIKGLNAVVVGNARSREIIAAKTGSPLAIGITSDGFYIASDSLALRPFTNKVVYLSDDQMVILGDRVQLLNLPAGEKSPLKVQNLTWSSDIASKKDFPHFMLKEIYEQPKIIDNIASNSPEKIKKAISLIRNSYGTFFIGCGSASYAALVGTYLFSKLAKRHVNFTIGSEFDYLQDYLTKRSLVIAFSQSGETVDILQPVLKAKNIGAKVVAVTNVIGSSLYRMADQNLLLEAGPERAVAASKTETAMFGLILYLSFALKRQAKKGQELLKKASVGVSDLLKDENVQEMKKLSRFIKDQTDIYIIGRGLSYALALEAALKMKEVAYLHAEGFAGGELKHGVLALIEKGTPVIVFVPNDETKDDIISNAREVKARGGFIIGVSPERNEVFDFYIKVPDVEEASIITSIIPFQLLAYFLALEKGYDPDYPRNLAKSVTVK